MSKRMNRWFGLWFTFSSVLACQSALSADEAPAKELVVIDLRPKEEKDGFGLARPSNTTPVVVLRFEADNEEALKRIEEDFRHALLAVKPDAQLPF